MNPSAALARVLVDELVRGGLREAVLAPGSRSAPLAFALAAADAAGRLRLHVRVDERTAGFLALGMAKAARRPVAVLTTSGTAVANLHPAVLEASHAGVPLVVLTADRPAHLRGTGANQTTDQVRIFGAAPRFFADVIPPARDIGQVGAWRSMAARAVLAATGGSTRQPGPVHLNLQLSEPLVPDDDADWMEPLDGRPGGRAWTVAEPSPAAPPTQLTVDSATVVVAGDDAGPPARLLSQAAGWPLLAEPTSGARTGPNALRCYRLLLDGALAERIERVVVFGHPTLSRPVTRLLARGDVEVVAVAPTAAGWTDPGHTVSRVLSAVTVDRPADLRWLADWQSADRRVSAAVDETVRPDAGSPLEVAAEVAAAVPPAGLLVVGSSNPIRDLDLMAPPYPVGERRKILANRGLSGIDGTVSTAIGAALARESSRAIAYLGDLTFLHDANGLLIGPDEPRPDLTIVVANDNGGSIFATLEQGAPQYQESFERTFGTPHGADLEALCAATCTPFERVDDRAHLRAALDRPAGGITVVECPIDRSNRRALVERLAAAAATAQERSSG